MANFNKVKFQIQFRLVLWIAFVWFLVGVLDTSFMASLYSNIYVQPTKDGNFVPALLITYGLGYGLCGFFVASLLIFFLKNKFRNNPFFHYLLVSIFLIVFIALIMNVFGYLIYFSIFLNQPLFHSTVLSSSFDMFLNPINIRNLTLGFLLSLGTAIALQVNDKYGPGVFIDLLIGKYHQPRKEERIFMFLDMRSSTTIAEKIGHLEFHNLLRDSFRDMTNSIIYSKGEIYQYVGDEVVVSWQVKQGLKEGNCIRCFYDIQKSIAKRKNDYLKKYGIVPEFKAGFHCGVITTGEIGVLKKDIVFSGDVLNTTARIQAMCNKVKAEVLISQSLHEKLKMSIDNYTSTKVGEFVLKGKAKRLVLYSISGV
jgi:adenylate cyclase